MPVYFLFKLPLRDDIYQNTNISRMYFWMVTSNLLKLWPSLNLVSHCLRTDSQLEQQTANIENEMVTLWCVTTVQFL